MNMVTNSPKLPDVLFLSDQLRHRLLEDGLLLQPLSAHAHGTGRDDQDLFTTPDQLGGLQTKAFTTNISNCNFSTKPHPTGTRMRTGSLQPDKLTCSTMLAIRVRLGNPSGVDTTLVPALMTTRWANGKSCLPRIMVYFPATSVTRLDVCSLLASVG